MIHHSLQNNYGSSPSSAQAQASSRTQHPPTHTHITRVTHKKHAGEEITRIIAR